MELILFYATLYLFLDAFYDTSIIRPLKIILAVLALPNFIYRLIRISKCGKYVFHYIFNHTINALVPGFMKYLYYYNKDNYILKTIKKLIIFNDEGMINIYESDNITVLKYINNIPRFGYRESIEIILKTVEKQDSFMKKINGEERYVIETKHFDLALDFTNKECSEYSYNLHVLKNKLKKGKILKRTNKNFNYCYNIYNYDKNIQEIEYERIYTPGEDILSSDDIFLILDKNNEEVFMSYIFEDAEIEEIKKNIDIEIKECIKSEIEPYIVYLNCHCRIDEIYEDSYLLL